MEKHSMIDLTPDVDISDMIADNELLQDKSTSIVNTISTNTKQHLTGSLSSQIISNFNFNQQYYTYNSYGYAQDPSDFSNNSIIKSSDSDLSKSIFGANKNSKANRFKMKMTRAKFNNPGTGDFNGPWGKYEGEEAFKNFSGGDLTEEQKGLLDQMETNRLNKIKEEEKEETNYLDFKPSTIYHLETELDYQGRSFIDPPKDLKNVDHNCYIPKKLSHTFSGHTKPVQVIKFFPKYGHYLLSCSLDCKIKLWDVLTHKKCARTYIGHSEGVRDICFSNNGRRFLSAGFDKVVRLWDTETGSVIQTFPNKKIPFCVLFNPDEDRQNSFLVGTSSKKILQYDINSNKEVKSYDEHLGAINTLTFIDNNRKFVSTSDDKKIFIWEFDLPVVVKHISEPSMHSIPAVALHPNGKYLLGQSLDNKIVVYECKNDFKINRKKKFTGHVNAGYACGLDFSPDGQFLCSGDSDGKLWFWDWRSARNYATINAHQRICIDVKWHPIQPSVVATASWDGTIKLWDSK